jgi:hypothetical protein
MLYAGTERLPSSGKLLLPLGLDYTGPYTELQLRNPHNLVVLFPVKCHTKYLMYTVW